MDILREHHDAVMNDSPDNPEGTTRGPAGTRNNGKGQLQRQRQGQLQRQPQGQLQRQLQWQLETGGSPVYIKFLHST